MSPTIRPSAEVCKTMLEACMAEAGYPHAKVRHDPTDGTWWVTGAPEAVHKRACRLVAKAAGRFTCCDDCAAVAKAEGRRMFPCDHEVRP